ncbi:winged helix-turn-helix transcriptional regulator [Deinococcus metallilatus]|uniref:Pseudouridine kinase n=1 Tax=Deinococcus metallilatus TaxID=1211322 RepID=A0AAJ5F292_9DEIO|nr:carbohydrate kinase [Deinococcus metallilatus]MBB5297024.1 pseudouridine kinase [Deinococcus metallilatus]QBY07846.1 winged helix-turn-helix transcriptional regulator [Deinococcus metallilatus]RXJ13195.1 winged helix-turn-helix transcriptional regulator [Deinococcus metallilatus]TLK23032.1 winged helix-turn-helix transcriptional regulator [Deinococcus metallilatus]GMA15990.1 carbohydrate kinase [Deinococcus metallilatus]
MFLTDRERALLALIREAPLSTPEELARRLGTSRAAVNVHVSNLIRKGALLGRGYVVAPENEARVVVVGGANVDVKARTLAPAVMGTSNPGATTQAPGGVARNIAENLARLGVRTHLIAAVGRDAPGDLLLRETEAAGVDVRSVLRLDAPTGTYTAVLDDRGELLIAVAAMEVTEALTPAALNERRGLLHRATSVIADGNLSAQTLTHLLTLCAEAGVPVTFEPVSVPKTARLLPALHAGLAPHTVTPNVAELAALLGRDVADTPAALRKAAGDLHARGVQTVWVRRGERGSLLSGPDGVSELPALPARVVDVTGAGDAMLAAYLAALLTGHTPAEAARQGHAAAALTVESARAVSPTLTPGAVRARLHSPQP